ncbi:hypothetical protein ASALC70_03907 [Alcanivorax sp. ALC70]|nr:hypothetical protein ASALC70_03907 [Alcanivorax sp. ALC70]
MADQGEDEGAADDVAGQGGQPEAQGELRPGGLAGEHQIKNLAGADDDVREFADRHHVGHDQDHPGLGLVRRGHHPHHGGDDPAGDDALGEHLEGAVFQHLVAQIQEGAAHLRGEHGQVQEGEGGDAGADDVAGQHHAPQPHQAPQIAQGGVAHERQDGGDGVFGEQLLAGQNHDQKAQRVAHAADQKAGVAVRQMGVEQASRHQRGAHGDAGGDRRPQQRHGVPFQFLLAGHAQPFVHGGGPRGQVLFLFGFVVAVVVGVPGRALALPFHRVFPGAAFLVLGAPVFVVVQAALLWAAVTG